VPGGGSEPGQFLSLAGAVELPVEEEMEVRAAIQAVVLEHRRRYGYRRVTRELRRRGMVVNHKRVARLMREDNLLAVQPRAWVATTDSGHELEVYMNLAAHEADRNQPVVGGRHHLHPAGRRVRLPGRGAGRSRARWWAGRWADPGGALPLAALKQAIELRQPPPGLVHHSDRGLQYASRSTPRCCACTASCPA
jgi:putative transposase